MPEQLEVIIRDIGGDPSKTVIWLHGLGADGHDFEAIIPDLRLPQNANIRFIFPHAPIRPISVNNGMQMRSWYDITDPNLALNQDITGIEQSTHLINQLMDSEMAAGRRVLLAGFSQGGVIALHAGLRYSYPLEGLLILSSYLAAPDRLENERKVANQNTPILMMHGMYDPLIPLALSHHSQQILTSLGYQVERKDYPMPHSVHPDQIKDIAHWLQVRLGLPD